MMEAQAGYAGATGFVLATADRNRLIEEHLPMVRYLVKRMAVNLPRHLDEDDLIGAGLVGLVSAADRFDPSRGVLFKTFVEQRVRGIILDELRANDWLSRSSRDRFKQMERVVRDLEQRLQRDPEPEEVAAALQLSLEGYYDLLSEVAPCSFISLDEGWMIGGEDDCVGISDTIEDKESGNPQSNALAREAVAALADAIDQLPEREKLIITLYHYEEMTLREIAEILSISEARVSQLHTHSVLKLRGRLKAHA